MEIPFDRLSSELLRRIIEVFVLQEGTDYGSQEFSLEEKVSQVQRQIHSGEVKIYFNEDDGTCTLRRV